MQIAYRAYNDLVGELPKQEMEIKYSGRFKDYNGNVQYSSGHMTFSLSKKWKDVSDEIVIGLLQTLILKTLRRTKRVKIKGDTFYINLYNDFIRNLSSYADVKNTDPFLIRSFNRINEKFFGGMMDAPNLRWGGFSESQLGCYTYAENTVTISQVLIENDELLDFVMYHELLHKKHKFEHRGSRTFSHTSAFRADEKKFSDKDMDKELHKFLRERKRKSKITSLRIPKKQHVLLSWFKR